MSYVGGEDLSAIVVDLGESMLKVGFAGEDIPRFYQPAVAGFSETSIKKGLKRPDYVGSEAVDVVRTQMQLHSHIEDGLWSDWDIIEQIVESSCESFLSIKPSGKINAERARNLCPHAMLTCFLMLLLSLLLLPLAEHPFLFAEPSFNTKAIREKMTELMFEKYDVPAFFISKCAVLSCFANGRSTGLVIDIGGGTSSVVPVHDGYAVQKATMRSSVAGRTLDRQLLQLLENKGVSIRPRFQKEDVRAQEDSPEDDRPQYHPSFLEFHRLEIIRDLKESVCRCSDGAFDEATHAQIPTVPYELPDGKIVETGTERFTVPEILFEPSMNIITKDAASTEPLQKLILDSAMNCDMDIRRDLFHNMVLTGGGSCFEGITTRIEREVAALAPPVFKTKILAAHPPERRLGAWLGGSILGSLGSFTEMWMSKGEYAEHGPTVVERKCP